MHAKHFRSLCCLWEDETRGPGEARSSRVQAERPDPRRMNGQANMAQTGGIRLIPSLQYHTLRSQLPWAKIACTISRHSVGVPDDNITDVCTNSACWSRGCASTEHSQQQKLLLACCALSDFANLQQKSSSKAECEIIVHDASSIRSGRRLESVAAQSWSAVAG
ncbi:hypothetical protein WJX74_000249 [Apatococcus lobatus]|uniref:Uncharacterized protein n=1 Tax=Apatococcus lobatus TaxID=904363 RepID=A0AAW1SB84_9CHLO